MSNKKMSGKQAVSGGFDLNAFVGEAEVPSPPKEDQMKPAAVASAVKTQKPKTKPPATKKPSDELVSERVQILVSPAELTRIKEQAGLVSVSKFLRKYLQDQGLI